MPAKGQIECPRWKASQVILQMGIYVLSAHPWQAMFKKKSVENSWIRCMIIHVHYRYSILYTCKGQCLQKAMLEEGNACKRPNRVPSVMFFGLIHGRQCSKRNPWKIVGSDVWLYMCTIDILYYIPAKGNACRRQCLRKAMPAKGQIECPRWAVSE